MDKLWYPAENILFYVTQLDVSQSLGVDETYE